MKAENLHMYLVSARDRVGYNRSFAIKRNVNAVITEEGYEVVRGDFLLRSEIILCV